MVIEDYSFGHICIDGKDYASDVIIYPDRVNSHWWHKEGHRLGLKDLSEVIAAAPRVVVIGTSYLGRIKVPQATLDALNAQPIKTYVGRTREAVEEFNRLQREAASAVAALHLTC